MSETEKKRRRKWLLRRKKHQLAVGAAMASLDLEQMFSETVRSSGPIRWLVNDGNSTTFQGWLGQSY